ncbi:hypothetical protein CDD81_242 [Ophiocordyceps australis]|uniref:Transcription factor hoxa13 n=1 Tax=Ophiocordyceps australis TaxID=1399860 RepID=A0A2C5XBI6_9HYPO|nr:hypothetical protein CDD81_242 [Ophiocordyceps australis]
MAAAATASPARANGTLTKPSSSSSRPGRKGRGFVVWAFGVLARLATWAAILTVLFRCPQSLQDCNEQSPHICKYYFQARNAISPHVKPYYDHYAAPYVEVAKPYYQAVDGHVLTPTREIATHYAAPLVKQGQDFAWNQWEANGQPRVARFLDLSRAHYDRSVAPPLAKAGQALSPYYDAVTGQSVWVYNNYVLPSYQYARPYAVDCYTVASEFTTGTALPATYWAWQKTGTFLDTSVWPQVRVLYAEHVEPQLLRIGERLGRHKGKAQSTVVPEEKASVVGDESRTTEASSEAVPLSSTSISPTKAETLSAAGEATTEPQETKDFWHPVQAPLPAENESERRRKAREMVTEDLEQWQTKFVNQADEGAVDIEDSVDEVARKIMEEKANVTGKMLLQSLRETADSEIANLKRNITSIVSSGSKDAQEQAIAAVRSAGLVIKKTAQKMRSWREDYDAELQESITAAADVHFEILDETRGLALQQIGMKWAWTEGITYKDWAKYHELKKTLWQWTDELKQLITSHPTLIKAQDLAAQLEEEAMEVASKAAAQLGQLKEVARWKIAAGDSTENFDIDDMRLAAEAAGSEAATNAADTDDTVAATLDATSESLGPSVSAASNSHPGTLQTTAESMAHEEPLSESIAQEASVASTIKKNDAHDTISVDNEEAREAVFIADEDQIVISKVSTPPDETASSFDDVTDSVLLEDAGSNTSTDTPDDAESDIEEDKATSKVDPLAAEAAKGKRAAMTMEADNLSQDGSSASVAETEASEEEHDSTFGHRRGDADGDGIYAGAFGAAAQSVPDRQPVMDEAEDSDMIDSATRAAQEAYSSAVSAASNHYSSALSVVSAQIYGTPKPVHEQLLSSVSAVYNHALSTASNKLDDALTVISSGVHAQPTRTSSSDSLNWAKVESIAAERLNEGRLWADVQYHSALIALGLAEPTPTSTGDKMKQQAKLNYYAGLGAAQERYIKFVSAASLAWASVTATPTPTDLTGSASSLAAEASATASSLASKAGASASSAVAEAEAAAKSAYSAATDGVGSAAGAVESKMSSLVDAAEEQVYSAGAAIGMSWETMLSEISAQVYGEPTPIGFFDQMIESAEAGASAGKQTAAEAASTAQQVAATASASAAKQMEGVREIVSELIGGKEPSFKESVLARLERVYATAGSLADEATASAKSVASQATDAVKDGVKQARDEL